MASTSQNVSTSRNADTSQHWKKGLKQNSNLISANLRNTTEYYYGNYKPQQKKDKSCSWVRGQHFNIVRGMAIWERGIE